MPLQLCRTDCRPDKQKTNKIIFYKIEITQYIGIQIVFQLLINFVFCFTFKLLGFKLLGYSIVFKCYLLLNTFHN